MLAKIEFDEQDAIKRWMMALLIVIFMTTPNALCY